MIFLEKQKKILFIVPHRPGRSPGQRFRFEQYLDFLVHNGFSYEFSYIIDEKDDTIFYQQGRYISKFLILLRSIRKRLADIRKANDYDILFIYREALMIGSVYFEKQFKKSRAKIILDFDDAIWLPDVSKGNRKLRWLKRPTKTADIIHLSDMVVVGNKFLANYAKQYNTNVEIIPTTIDTDYYQKKSIIKSTDTICIGWTGSTTTLKHFMTAIPFLKILKNKYGDKICFRLISDVLIQQPEIEIEQIYWNKSTELVDLGYCDIGIMPLPDDEWSKGKCGFKGLQYMALEIPAVMSPVGVNIEIIKDSENGFLASTPEEWVDKLSYLIESETLRQKFGKAGRQTVLDKFSFNSQKQRYLECFKAVLQK